MIGLFDKLRGRGAQPCRRRVLELMQAIDAEQSLESFEAILGSDPVLAYRFMLYNNSAALGLRTGVDSLRRGLASLPGQVGGGTGLYDTVLAAYERSTRR